MIFAFLAFIVISRVQTAFSQSQQLPQGTRGERGDKSAVSERGKDLLKGSHESFPQGTFSLTVVIDKGGYVARCHVAAGGELIRPGQEYRVGLLLCGSSSVNVNINIFTTTTTVAQARVTLQPGYHIIPIKIPEEITHGNYTAIIEGKETNSILSFRTISSLIFSPKFLSIVIQTSRPIYTSSQIVRFRILALDTRLYPYDDALEIYIIDPDNLIMRRWLSIYTNNGIASLKFKLPSLAKEGYWKIRIKAKDQIEELRIKVENYFPPLFEVFVEIPPYILETKENIEAKIYGKYISEEIARGNATIKAYLISDNSSEGILFYKEKKFIKTKDAKVTIPLNLINNPVGNEIKVEAVMKEFLSGETVTGFSKTRIIRSSIKIRFLTDQPAFFKPSMPFHSYVSVQYGDNVPINSEFLEESKIRLEVTFHIKGGTDISMSFMFSPSQRAVELNSIRDSFDVILVDPKSESDYTDTGVLGFNILPPQDTEKVTVTARYSDNSENSAETKQVFHKFETDDGKYISLWTTTEDAVVEEYAIFHVKMNFWTSSFQYLIISKGSVLNGDEVTVSGDSTSFSITLSPDMAPGFRLIVFVVESGKLLSDSLYLPLSAFNRYEMELIMNRGKDFRGDLVELIVSGDEAAYICAHSVRSTAYKIHAGNEMTESRVINSFIALENFRKTVNKVLTRDREGETDEKTVYYQTADYGKDANDSFSLVGLFLSSHAKINSSAGPCATLGSEWIPCFDGSCYTHQHRCDGIPFCPDSSDELNCETKFEEDFDYKIHRISRSTYLYDKEFGDWGWKEIKKNDHEGVEFEPLDAPSLDEEWYFNAFSVSPKYGFSIISEPLVYSTKRPFAAHISGPSSCKRGEQVGLRIILKNNDPSQALVLLRLISSPDYKFVHVEAGGSVSSYSARLSSGQHHLLVYIAPESQEHIDYPISPTVEQGEIEVKFVASTMTGRAVLVHKMTVLPEGAVVSRHTSIMLDLKSRAYSLNYLDIVVEETPIVPYQEWRRYIYGSPKASLTVNGDVIGPVFPKIPMKQEDILGRHGKGTDSRIMEFCVNILNLRYLRFTNKITPSILRETLEESNTIYAHAMKRFNLEGWFSNWDFSEPSVWLTAWAIRAFRLAMYADWENILYIDSKIFQQSVKWLLTHQTESGSFVEENGFYHALDANMKENRSLTAHVILGLVPCLDAVEGKVRSDAVRGILRAVKYLEKNLPTEPHSLALVTLAVHIAQSNVREESYFKLLAMVNEEGDQIYWGREKIPSAPIKIQNQRPFLLPRRYVEGLSEAIQTTSIALLVSLIREGVTPLADKIVLTLNTLRMSNSGFVSLMDTTWALEALTEYANRARVLELTNIDVNINSGVDPNFKHIIHITNSTLLDSQFLKLDTVWGHVNVIGKGAGLALAQMDVSYGVDWEPLKDKSTKESFHLAVREFYSHERNKSAITIETCMRWLRPNQSGRAILEMEIPTGYHLVESEAVKYIYDVPLLQDAKTLPGLTMWFFHHIPNERNCFNHTVRRWHPVANMSLTRQALLYETSARENFVQTLVNSTSLYILNICEVCGSYQCPYCPFYNASSRTISSSLFILIITLFKYTYNLTL